MKDVTQQQARESLDAFVKTVVSCINDNHYELILAAGDSGHIAAWVTREIFLRLKGEAPLVTVIPAFRHSDEAETILFDNRKIASKLNLPKETMQKVLIVDDEVESGNTIRGLLAALGERVVEKPLVTFIAEDSGFDPTNVPKEWNFVFKPSKLRQKNVFNAIAYNAPAEFADPVRNALNGVVPWLNTKHIMLTLLDLPIKEMHQERPIFTFEYRDIAKQKVSNLAELQSNFQQHLRSLISQSL